MRRKSKAAGDKNGKGQGREVKEFVRTFLQTADIKTETLSGAMRKAKEWFGSRTVELADEIEQELLRIF